MKSPIIGLCVLASLAVLFLAGLAGWKLQHNAGRISRLCLLVTVLLFAALSARPRFVGALHDNTAFTIPGDHEDHYELGWPAGFWRSFPDPAWNVLHHQLDPRGVVADAIFWGYWCLVAIVPVLAHCIRRSTGRRSAGDRPEGAVGERAGASF